MSAVLNDVGKTTLRKDNDDDVVAVIANILPVKIIRRKVFINDTLPLLLPPPPPFLLIVLLRGLR